MKTIALYIIKGGVGKTAARVTLAYLAARDHRPTLSLLTYRKLGRFYDDSSLDVGKQVPFLSMVESSKRMHRDMIKAIMAAQASLMNACIPYNAEVEQMGYHRAPLAHYRPASAGAAAFADLWQEIRNRILKENGDGPGD